MIVDVRTYTAFPGRLPAYFADYAAGPFEVQKRHLGNPLGYYHVDTGVVNTLVHLWGYKDIADRQVRRDAMQKDPAWQAWLAHGAGRFASQENQIFKAAPFWPIAGQAQGGYGLVDFRLYTAFHGKLGELVKVYQALGLETQVKHLGNCLGWYQSDIGGQNQILHLWGYKDAADRQTRRAAMNADPKWGEYLKAATPLLSRMTNQLLLNAPFFKP
ncbi:MAG: NIPSNAP family protein [Rhodospirillales bacterium]|nr:NIPSNAP family protein [Rhodospirillales bacterium]